MVTRYSSDIAFIADYRAKFPPPLSSPVMTIATPKAMLDVRISEGLYDAEYVGAFDGHELVAMVNTWAPDEPLLYRHIGKTIVAPTYQGHRITRQIIEWLVITRNERLASDENQTNEGAGVWESMIMRSPRLRFFLWEPDGRETPLCVKNGRIVPDPWADPHSRLLACQLAFQCILFWNGKIRVTASPVFQAFFSSGCRPVIGTVPWVGGRTASYGSQRSGPGCPESRSPTQTKRKSCLKDVLSAVYPFEAPEMS